MVLRDLSGAGLIACVQGQPALRFGQRGAERPCIVGTTVMHHQCIERFGRVALIGQAHAWRLERRQQCSREASAAPALTDAIWA